MPKVIVGTGSSNGLDTNIAPGVFRYFAIDYGYCATIYNEDEAKGSWGISGLFFNACITVRSNTMTAATTHYRTRINGANGNFDIQIPPGLTGTFTDLSSYDVITEGDEVNFMLESDAVGIGGLHFTVATLNFIADSAHAVQMGNSHKPISVTSNGFQRRVGLAGLCAYSTSPTLSEVHTDVDGVLSRLMANVQVNARTTNTTAVSRVNGANGNMSIVIPPGLTGIFIDISNSDALTAGDTFGSAINFGASAENFALCSTQAVFTNFLTREMNIYNGALNTGRLRPASSTPSYSVILGNIDTYGTSEDNDKHQINFDCTWSKLGCRVSTNSYTTDATVRLRIDNTDANQVVTIPAGLTGLFQDLSNTDVITQGQELNYLVEGGTTGNMTIRYFSSLVDTPQGEYASGYIF